MTKHTQGPWAVGPAFDNDGEPEIIVEHHTPAGNLVVAVALSGLRGQAANARLIAAAPDLLAALVNLLNDTQHAEHPDCDDGPCPVREARAAIQKATGGTHKEQV